jgi:hypothetical protein
MHIKAILTNECLDLLFDPEDLDLFDLYHRHLNFLHMTLPHYGDHLSYVILKSCFACGSYSPVTGFASTPPKCDSDL